MELQTIQQRIYEIRGQKVMLDFDLAELYEVETKALNQAVKRNIKRFPTNFMFRLLPEEFKEMRSQFVTASGLKNRNKSFPPFAFTEHGVTMLSGVLKSDKAISINIAIVEAFIKMRSYSLNIRGIEDKLTFIEQKYNQQFDDINEVINYLLKKDTQNKQQANRKKIGFSE